MGRVKDLAGERFGDWVVLERAGSDSNGGAMWMCRCACGTEKAVSGNTLVRGQSRSCHPCSVKPADLTGERFGRLTVLEDGGRSPSGQAIWRCECECGNNTLVVGYDLRSGSTRSCGCLQRDIATRNASREVVTYGQVHRRLVEQRGAAVNHRCVDCGRPAEHWSYRGGAEDESPSERGAYSHDIRYYVARCVPCHRRFDRGSISKDKNFGLGGAQIAQPLVPGSDSWVDAGVSGSRIAAIVGKSQYASLFSWYHVMAHNLSYDSTPNEIQQRGHLLEPAIRQWFFEQHEELGVHPGGTWRHPDNERFIASPDGILTSVGDTVLLECKTAAHMDEWGDEGTDQIPPGYRVQVMWAMHVTGARKCFIAVLGSWLDFREYVVHYDASEASELVAAATDFLEMLPGGKNPRLPNLDGHAATYEAIKRLNPQIQEGSVEIDQDLAAAYVEARAAMKESEDRARRYAGEIADKLGPFKDAVVTMDGEVHKVAYRKAGRKGSPPFLVAAKSNLSRKVA